MQDSGFSGNDIRNWKLLEVIDSVEIIADKSQEFVPYILKKLALPEDYNYSMNHKTEICWEKMPVCYKFMYYRDNIVNTVKVALRNSLLKNHEAIIITYGWNEPVVKIPLSVFYQDWDGFIASTVWQTLMFSEDYQLIMEANDLNILYSNFKIL